MKISWEKVCQEITMLCITCKENIFLFLERNDVMGFTMESPFSSEIFAIRYKICHITLFSHNTGPYELNSLILINLTIKNASFSLQAGRSVTQILGAGDYLEEKESQKMSNQLLIISNPIGTSKASTITQGGV